MVLDLRSALLGTHKEQFPQKRRQLSTGLTLLNLLLTGDCSYGIESGSVVWLSGPSDSGRTTVGLTLLAEATQTVDFVNYRLYYNNTEGQDVNIGAYFGNNVAARIRAVQCSDAMAFWEGMRQRGGRSIYFLDSLDGLLNDTWQINNAYAKDVFDRVRETDSILIIAAQEKLAGDKRVTAGGFAMPFYADYSIKTIHSGSIVRVIRGKERVLGTNTTLSAIKSKIGIKGAVSVPAPIFSGSGYDNAESLFMFLRRKGVITGTNEYYHFSEFGFEGKFSSLLNDIRQFESMIASWVESRVSELLV